MLCSIIIPIFNQEKSLKACFSTFKLRKDYELILINDGSTDHSAAICSRYAKWHKNVHYFEQKNKGVSAARNLGLKHASGKYIFFLDADDRLEKGTIENVCEFFDSVYDEVDLVTYPIETHYKGKVLPPHFRYRYLKETGVYDYREYPFIGQTTMNIVVKNRFEDNILFDESMTFSEDQKYCCAVVKDKLKIGFCAEGKYIYNRSENSSSGKMSGSCFIFEQCMKMFEDIFAEYDEEELVPAAYQGLFVNDVYWKLISNILLPYHYPQEEYEKAVGRITRLLRRCENYVFLDHPAIDYFEKYYLLRMKNDASVTLCPQAGEYHIYSWDVLVLKDNKIELVMTRFRVNGAKVRICGFLKSVAFHFYDAKPILCVAENGGKLTRVLPLYPSAHCYYRAREATQRFWAFDYEMDVAEVHDIRFEVEMGGFRYSVKYYFMPEVPFSNFNKSYKYRSGLVEASVQEDSSITFKLREDVEKSERIWLYYDCKGVSCDNGLQQFNHDYEMADGIRRYYILSDPKQKENTEASAEYLIPFGSDEHKNLLLRAEKILTAYIEDENIFPYGKDEIEKVSSGYGFEVIYLQHGVLHIKMPWKFSPEKIAADRVVISTKQEERLFMENGFRECDLIRTGMPRFDIRNRKSVDKAEPQKEEKASVKGRILYAPSWRSYLVGSYEGNEWKPLNEKFLASTFYQEVISFLNDSALQSLLENSGYVLEVKLHPIFMKYLDYFKKSVRHGNIVFVEEIRNASDYNLFVTDISSFQYDFLLENVPVMNFIPDINEFRCGMNGYRELNYTEEFWKNVATEHGQIIEKLAQFIKAGEYYPFDVDFYDVDQSMDHIYQTLLDI